ncbi:MAG: tripartite tricarboxylate transporter TctB family protein [Parvibaculaceae bacterium]
MTANGRIMTSLVMLLVFAFFVSQAAFFRPEAALMPLLVGLPGLVLSLVQFVVDLRAGRNRKDDEPIVSRGERPIMVWLILFTLGIILFGFSLAAPLLLAAYLFFTADERLPVALAGGALCFAVLYGLERLMNMPLFEGLAIHYLS